MGENTGQPAARRVVFYSDLAVLCDRVRAEKVTGVSFSTLIPRSQLDGHDRKRITECYRVNR
jgi:hypothetical protein